MREQVLVLVIGALSAWCTVAGNFMVSKDANSCDRQPKKYIPIENVRRFPSPKNNNSDKSIRFGVLLPPEPEKYDPVSLWPALAATELAIHDLQREDGLLEEFDVTVDYKITTSSVSATFASFEMYSLSPPDAFLGPVSDYLVASVSRSAEFWNIPMITSGGFSEAFSIKNIYPVVTRVGPSVYVPYIFSSIFKHFDWKLTYFMFHNHGADTGKGNSVCSFISVCVRRALEMDNVKVTAEMLDEDTATHDEYLRTLNIAKNESRIIIMCADPNTIREVMLAADELNMIDSGEYVFFNIELFSSMSTISKPWYNATDPPERNERAKKAYTALFTVISKQPEHPEYLEFSNELKKVAATKYDFVFPNETVSTFVTAFYDAVLLYAYALNDSIAEDPSGLCKPLNGTRLTHLMWNRSFTGITGNVTIDKNGDRISDYSLLDMDAETGLFRTVANYYNASGLQFVKDVQIHWAGGRTGPPLDTPVCGFDNSLCPDLPGYAILSFVLGVVVIVMAIISFFGYRHYKLEAEILSMTWKVSWHDVLACDGTPKNPLGSVHSFAMAKRGSQLTIYSEEASLAGDRQIYVPIGFYRGNKVAIKRINQKSIHLNRALMLELKKMKDIHHEHLVKFYGACVEPPNCCILTEYCPKGSLQDLLENDSIKLDWMFKISLMHDIVRGMHYLHTTDIRSHGNLKSSNCVVDSRFVLKIADFGLNSLRKNFEDEIDFRDTYAYWKSLLWTAPELLRMKDAPVKGTQKGDVYSFGIIVSEIVTRQGPYYLGASLMSPKEISQAVIAGPAPNKPPFRPVIRDVGFDGLQGIMERCWKEDPLERPDFGMLKTTFRKVNKENETGNIVDNLLKRMEQYANNLEGLVEERTQDYLEEKHKCEELLYQLLPRSVAAQLIMGKPVIAEVFERVTIYFSDIVGFTALSAASTPMQVVDLLNDLYTCFDSIVENFDVYKVETIGDAYMVVSGLPQRNGDNHAREIARTAISLLHNVYKFQIRHRPNEQLRLRIGLHSGSCVAGVVGLKMPRYCLFGDTVNTASRMESTGEPLKIHISPSTKAILDKFGTFDIIERGVVEMKGKGRMLTYWLNGEENSDDYLMRTAAGPKSALQAITSNGFSTPSAMPSTPICERKRDPVSLLRSGIVRSRSNSLIPPNDLKSRSNSLNLLTPSSPPIPNNEQCNGHASSAFSQPIKIPLNNLLKNSYVKNSNLSSSNNKLKINNNDESNRSVTIPLLSYRKK